MASGGGEGGAWGGGRHEVKGEIVVYWSGWDGKTEGTRGRKGIGQWVGQFGRLFSQQTRHSKLKHD